MRYKLRQASPDNPDFPDEAFRTTKEEIRSCRSSIYISPSQETIATEVDVFSWIKEQKLRFHDKLEEYEVSDGKKRRRLKNSHDF